MNSRPLRLAPILLALALAPSGCTCATPSGALDDCQAQVALPPSVSTDILFVIDNSGSMQEEQKKVVDQLGSFVQELVSAPIHNDFQLGVVTTGVTMDSALCGAAATPTCATFPNESGRLQRGKDLAGKVLDPQDKVVLGSSDPSLLDKARKLIGQGVAGPGQEMGLEAARRAVSEPLASSANAGFLRPGSRLLVIIVSDEDDCSDANDCSNPSGRLFIQGACGASCAVDADCAGAEGTYCLLVEPRDPSLGRRCTFNACESPAGRARLATLDSYLQFLKSLDDGTGSGRPREVFLAVIGAVDASLNPARCHVGTDEANGVGVRYKAIVDGLGSEHALIDSICNADYGAALARIATLVNAPQTVELARTPADPRLILFDVKRAAGGTTTCTFGQGFDYEAPTAAAKARVTFKGECRLFPGDQLELKVICAG